MNKKKKKKKASKVTESRFLTTEDKSHNNHKGKRVYEHCHVGLGVEVLMWTHGYQHKQTD